MSTRLSMTARLIATDATMTPNCESCPHTFARHDTMAQRYCRATAADALIRACICGAKKS